MAATCEWVDVGDGLRAYYGTPEGSGPHPCIVVYIEAFGVNDHFQKLTQRLADEGFATITPDIYDGEIYAYDNLDGAIGKLKAMDDETVMAQTEQCLDWLAGRIEADTSRAAVTGFCMGPMRSWRPALRERRLSMEVGLARKKISSAARRCWIASKRCRRRSCCGMARKISRYSRRS